MNKLEELEKKYKDLYTKSEDARKEWYDEKCKDFSINFEEKYKGKYFKYIERPNRSSISFWLCYLKPIKTDREFIICFSFQKDFRGKIIIEPNRILVARNLYDTAEEMLTDEISENEFYLSLNSIVRDINTFIP